MKPFQTLAALEARLARVWRCYVVGEQALIPQTSERWTCAGCPRKLEGRGRAAQFPWNRPSRTKLFASTRETPCAEARFAQIVTLPNTHVPVVVCRSAGIWTRGQLTVLGRPAAGGEPANPAKRGTRLEATTDRAFLVSAGPPKVGAQRGLSFLPGVRTGHFLVQTMALIA